MTSQAPGPAESLESLAAALEVLASPTRLQLLRVLRTAQALHEIRVQPARSQEGERPDRLLTRQAVTRHLEALREADLVRSLPSRDDREGERFLVNHEHLFALVDELRSLTKLRPITTEGWLPGLTMDRPDSSQPRLPEGPRLLVAYGRDDGIAFSLAGAVGARWRIGRAATSEVRLDYDPYLSGTHAIVDRDASGFCLRDAGSRNGTWVNWRRLGSETAQLLAPGDVVTVGRTVLTFQP